MKTLCKGLGSDFGIVCGALNGWIEAGRDKQHEERVRTLQACMRGSLRAVGCEYAYAVIRR